MAQFPIPLALVELLVLFLVELGVLAAQLRLVLIPPLAVEGDQLPQSRHPLVGLVVLVQPIRVV